MLFRKSKSLALAFAIASVLGATALDAAAQASRSERAEKNDKKSDASKALYPQATREEPKAKASAKATPKLQKMIKAYDADKGPEARAQADEILANAASNEYDKSFAAQIAAQVAYGADDAAAAKAYLKQAIDLNGLDNNGHYQSMMMLGQLQMQDDEYANALTTLDRYLGETKSTKPEDLVMKGNALYRLERYSEAIPVLKQAIDASPEPRADWQQLLMAAYADTDQTGEAVKLAEQIAAKTPNDKKALMNLASVYIQADKMDQAAATLEKVRASGQLSDDREYRQLYSAYLNIDGKEKEAIAAINEGLEKGILKPDHQAYLALAQAYYFSDQPAPAIDAYKKAAPLSKDGETYLNLAKVLWQEDRVPEAKTAAKEALAKGLKKPEEAKKITALP